MKKFLSLALVLALCLSLCACGRRTARQEAPAEAQTESAEATPVPTPVSASPWSYQRVDITAENWTEYFALAEVPLYSVTSSDAISDVCQNYCVVLRDAYYPFLKPDGEYSVSFTFAFDLYINTLEIDTEHYTYRHTDDLLYAGGAEKSAVFDRSALRANAYGNNFSSYGGYQNAFFTGWAHLDPVNEVWSGFQLELSQVRLVSVEGYLQLAKQ